jgi:hypothetical protein
MKTVVCFALAAMFCQALVAQEKKPVPKDSVRVFIPGCSKGYVFTAGPRTEDQPSGPPIPEGMHLRMSGPKTLMSEIKAHEGSRIEITGLVKKGQFAQGGVGIGGGVRVSGGPPVAGSGMGPGPGVSQNMIDVEGWRPVPGDCPGR